MNIYALKGHKVKCYTLSAGYKFDQERAKKHLVVGSSYTVENTNMENWQTDVYLQEFPGISFNSAFFEDESYQELESEPEKHPNYRKFHGVSQSEKIKQECEKLYEQIQVANNRLEELRKLCKHKNTRQGLYSWRVGSITEAIICSDCGSLIKNVINNNIRIE